MPTHDTSALGFKFAPLCCQSPRRPAGTPSSIAKAPAAGTTAELGATIIHTERKPCAAKSRLPSVLHGHIINQPVSWCKKEVLFSRVVVMVVVVVKASPATPGEDFHSSAPPAHHWWRKWSPSSPEGSLLEP